MAFFRLSFIALFGAVACGPSFQAVYECDVRFEHCYALDRSATSSESRKECWRQYLRGYTYGQSKDRVEYALARFGELSFVARPGDDPPAEPQQPARSVSATVASPVPTNPFAPPPNLAASASASAPASSALSSTASTSMGSAASPKGAAPSMRQGAPRAPAADCSDGCANRWASCRDSCRQSGCDECDRSYRACMPACFRDGGSPRHEPRSVR